MSNSFLRAAGILLVLLLAAAKSTAQPFSAEIAPKPVLEVMQRVADWQLAHPSRHHPTDWTQGAGYTGIMALAGISGDAKYRDAMLAMGKTNHWKLGKRKTHADDQAVGQTYCELYFLFRDPKMLAPMRADFDDILAHAPTNTNLKFKGEGAGGLWSWCDALFMAPPAWGRLSTATGDYKYLNYAVTNWWHTSDTLYDTNENLFYRDTRYFEKREDNGRKVFWGRGNGWVMGGLVRMLQYLPNNYPGRSRFEQQFKEMAAAVLKCQQPDGLWRASLLDPASYPLKETSGSGFYTYALAWGVNQGLLDKKTYEPAVRKAWAALVSCVDADGKLTHVQPIGADPKKFKEDATEVYGVGAFLLAGSEIYRMGALAWKQNPFRPSTALPPADHLVVKVANPASFQRECESVELDTVSKNEMKGPKGEHTGIYAVGASQVGMMATFGELVVMDGVSSRILDSQLYSPPIDDHDANKKLLFRVDLAPGETRTFYILDASALATVPPPIVKTFAPAKSDTNRPAQPLKVTLGN